MRPSEIHKNIKQLKAQASADLDCRIHSGIDEALAHSTDQSSVPSEPSLGRKIVRNSIKLSVAAIALLAVLIVVSMPAKVSFADVAKYIRDYHTIALDFIVGDEGQAPVIHDIIRGNRIRRTMSNMENIMIIDLDRKEMLNLDPASHGAALVGIEGMLADGTHKLLQMLRSIVVNVEENPGLAQKIGTRDFDGVETIGFEIKDHVGTFRLWADPVTATPKRIEMSMGNSSYILKNIEFDIPVPDELVSMDVPEGYTLGNQEAVQIGDPTEEDLLELFAFWAEHINDGLFPETVGVQELLQLLPEIQATAARLELTKEQEGEVGLHYARSMMYLQVIDQSQGEWHYAGQGVEFGDSDTAVLWYRLGDTKTYRVIYGDLHVEEVPLDQLP